MFLYMLCSHSKCKYSTSPIVHTGKPLERISLINNKSIYIDGGWDGTVFFHTI